MSDRLERKENVTLLEIEKGFRDAALRGGSISFTKFLSDMKVATPVCPVCGATMRIISTRSKSIVSLLGDGTYVRGYYGCECGHHGFPKDELLGIVRTSFALGVRRVVSHLAACDSFERSSITMEEVSGIYICSKDVERIAELPYDSASLHFGSYANKLLPFA